MLLEQPEGVLRFVAGPALTPSICQAVESLVPAAQNAGSCGAAAFLKRAVVVEDARTSAHWKDLPQVVAESQSFACWSIPIFDERQEVLGTFAISHAQKTRPTAFQEQLLETVSHLASIAIRRQRSEQELQIAQIAQNELAHVSRQTMLGEMAAGIAHELNQPLTALVNAAFVLEHKAGQDSPDSAEIQVRARRIREESMRAASIMQGMRRLVKKQAPKRVALKCDDVVAKALAVLEPEMRRQGVELSVSGCPDLPDIFADDVQIQQVLVNLIRNAIDAMKDTECGARKLTISTRLHTVAEVALRVADSGPGITPDHALAMFDAFNTTKNDGMGLGLTICRSIAERHNGRLIFEQVQPRGAALSLVLPVAQGQSEDEQ